MSSKKYNELIIISEDIQKLFSNLLWTLADEGNHKILNKVHEIKEVFDTLADEMRAEYE